MDLPGVAIRHVLYPLWAAKNRSPRLRYLAELEHSQFWPRQRILDQQLALFKALVTHAFANCPYYRQKFQQARLDPADLRTRADLDRVPTISKEEIQQHGPDLIAVTERARPLIRDMTGGSTGSPMQFCYTEDRLDSRVAATLRHNRWAGWRVGDRTALLWGAPQDTQLSARMVDRVRDWIQDRRLILDASSLTESTMAAFAQRLIRYKPDVIQAYANTLGLFARYVQSAGIQTIRPRAIVCSAEVLTEENRGLIERTFGCSVYNRYGCREVAVIASECERHRGLHINAENLLVEVMADGRSVVDQNGEILITDLRNLAMPLIRYRIRDMGRLTGSTCDCGRSLPLMELSGGRVTDFLISTDGRRVSGIVLATYAITNIKGIQQVQFVQHARGALTIKIVRGADWTDQAHQQLRGNVRRQLGADMALNTEFLDDIPSEKSGKYRFSISCVAGAQ